MGYRGLKPAVQGEVKVDGLKTISIKPETYDRLSIMANGGRIVMMILSVNYVSS
jgi:hypothetical protein